jgi:hypothetical protein
MHSTSGSQSSILAAHISTGSKHTKKNWIFTTLARVNKSDEEEKTIGKCTATIGAIPLRWTNTCTELITLTSIITWTTHTFTIMIKHIQWITSSLSQRRKEGSQCIHWVVKQKGTLIVVVLVMKSVAFPPKAPRNSKGL